MIIVTRGNGSLTAQRLGIYQREFKVESAPRLRCKRSSLKHSGATIGSGVVKQPSSRPPPLKPNLPIRSGQERLFRPGRTYGWTSHGVIHHRPHLAKPPSRPGEPAFPTGEPGGPRRPAQAEFKLLVVREVCDCCHNLTFVLRG